MSSAGKDVTTLLGELSRGNKEALDEMMPLVYAELRRMARSYLRRERADHTLQPTALVNEAYLRLVGQREVDWQNREHFFGVAAQMMRRILVNHAEAKHAEKRGGHDRKVSLDAALAFFESREIDLIELDEALDRLTALDPAQARVVELKFFMGLTIEEIAEVTNTSPATVKREWNMAKTWLYTQLAPRT